jgi:hypothetical protein
MSIPASPQDLTPGFAFKSKSLGTAWGVLRDGDREVWRCSSLPAHKPHGVVTLARQCAERERERRVQGGREVIELFRCRACFVFWDSAPPGDALRALLAGNCPACGGPVSWVKVVVIELGKPGVR